METRGGNTRHTRQRSDITPPLPKGVSRVVIVLQGRGGGHSGGPSGQTQIPTQDGASSSRERRAWVSHGWRRHRPRMAGSVSRGWRREPRERRSAG